MVSDATTDRISKVFEISRNGIRERDVSHFDVVVPTTEKLDGAEVLSDLLGEDVVGLDVLNFDITGVGHVG